jgi:uncharacterized protein
MIYGMATIPLFPLNTVLFPDGYLQLRIFEVRYLELMRQCVAKDSEFGVTSLVRGRETRVPGQDARLSEFGTQARILDITGELGSLQHVRCLGTHRFKILSSEVQKNGLWIAEVAPLEPDLVVPVPKELDDTSRALGHLIAALQQEGLEPNDFPLLPPYRLNDCGWVSNRWCDLLPLNSQEKQRLLSLNNPLLRLELVQDLLNDRGWLE